MSSLRPEIQGHLVTISVAKVKTGAVLVHHPQPHCCMRMFRLRQNLAKSSAFFSVKTFQWKGTCHRIHWQIDIWHHSTNFDIVTALKPTASYNVKGRFRFTEIFQSKLRPCRALLRCRCCCLAAPGADNGTSSMSTAALSSLAQILHSPTSSCPRHVTHEDGMNWWTMRGWAAQSRATELHRTHKGRSWLSWFILETI